MGKLSWLKLGLVFVILVVSVFNNGTSAQHIELNQENNEINEIVYGLEGELVEFSQWNASLYYTNQWLSAFSGSLYHRSSEEDLKFAPMLADGEPIQSQDGLIWTIDLKSDLKFSNGNPLTAADVIFTYQVALTPEINVGSYWQYSFFFQSNSSIVEIDEDTVQFTFTGVNVFLQNAFTLSIIEKAEYVEIYNSCVTGIKADCNWGDPSGTFAQSAGPYKIKNFNITEQQATLIRNEHYYDADNVWADQIVMKYNLSSEETVEQFKNGEIDVIDHLLAIIDGVTLDNFTGMSNVKQVTSAAPVVQEITLNHLHTIWGTGEAIPDGSGISQNNVIQANLVRKALSHIVNRDRIANVILNGFASPASTPVHPVVAGFNQDLIPRNFSIDIAKNYMQMAGFDYSNLIDANLDGDYGDETDTTFFNITILAPSWDSFRVQYAEEYAVELPKIGIGVKKVHINQTEGGFADVGARSYGYSDGVPPLYDEGGFDMLFIGHSYNAFTWDSYGRFSRDGLCDVDTLCRNWINYENLIVEQLIDSYNNQLNESKKAEILNEIQIAFYDDIPTIPIISPIDPWILAGDVEGINPVLLQNTQQEWQNVKKSLWTEIDTNKFVEDSSSDNDFPSTRFIFGGVAIIAVAVVVMSYRTRSR